MINASAVGLQIRFYTNENDNDDDESTESHALTLTNIHIHSHSSLPQSNEIKKKYGD